MTASPGARDLHGCGWSTLALTRAELAVAQARARAAHPGAAIVDSCQRIEAYGLRPCECGAPERWAGEAALQHLAEVAAGLQSVVLGEEQILGQVRQGFASATGSLRDAADTAIGAARQLRAETRFDSHAGALLDRALSMSGFTAVGSLLVIGTGAMGRLVAERGAGIGFAQVTVAGRTQPEWLRPAWEYLPLTALPGPATYDVAAGCLGSQADPLDAAAFTKVRRLLVDLGTPRNFEGIGPVPIIAIEDLFADETRRPHAMKRRANLRERLAEMLAQRAGDGHDGESPVGVMRYEVERVRQRELERMRRLHPEVDPETLDVLTRSLVNQIFHAPSQRLKTMDDPDLAQAIAQLFSSKGIPEE